jgi:hypothetical protein
MICRSPLLIGEVIPISDYALSKMSELPGANKFLMLGHLAQFTHDECFIEAGWPIENSDKYALYDRTIVGQDEFQDDKVATFETTNGKISGFHTISNDEHIFWTSRLKQGFDTIIQSFSYTDTSYTNIKYHGPISFKSLHDLNSIKTGASSYYFYRNLAYRFNLATTPI